MSTFQKVSCVRITVRTTEPDYVYLHKPNSSLCAGDRIGYGAGRQDFYLGERCIQSSGHVLHEFMHAAGFYHEMSRIDRDKYVTVNYDNIPKGGCAVGQASANLFPLIK